ncbi:hypothetical protein BDW02DRAFT_595362 [Decorospora gaudefroyi]|uniref:Uncharacterized protein n=1 Tax=Decorospora gaudefroyi TaxID=184978 RepID=A0A6A5KKQ9_9PLEO|nr:hypothetical protein BDW02DRAFT_595362 [Decorospora gaudefroyi]
MSNNQQQQPEPEREPQPNPHPKHGTMLGIANRGNTTRVYYSYNPDEDPNIEAIPPLNATNGAQSNARTYSTRTIENNPYTTSPNTSSYCAGAAFANTIIFPAHDVFSVGRTCGRKRWVGAEIKDGDGDGDEDSGSEYSSDDGDTGDERDGDVYRNTNKSPTHHQNRNPDQATSKTNTTTTPDQPIPALEVYNKRKAPAIDATEPESSRKKLHRDAGLLRCEEEVFGPKGDGSSEASSYTVGRRGSLGSGVESQASSYTVGRRGSLGSGFGVEDRDADGEEEEEEDSDDEGDAFASSYREGSGK